MRVTIRRLAVLCVLCCATVVIGEGGQYLSAARQAMQSGDHTAAIENYMKAISADPTNADAQAELGVAYLQMNNLKAAENRFSKAKSIEPKNTMALLGQAILQARQGEKEKAKALLKEVEQTGVGRGGGLAERRENRIEQRLLQLARREIIGSTREDAKDTVSVSRSAAQMIRMGNYKEAVELLKPLLNDKPETAMLWVQYGKAHQGQGNWTDAKAAFNKAIEITNDSGPAAQMARQQLKIITGR
ncbi:MAG: tetratricopeptide repeat protein [Planctomycetota bacterium]